MAYQLSAEEVLSLAALPVVGRMMGSGRGGMAANVLSSALGGRSRAGELASMIQGSTGERVAVSPDVNSVATALTPSDVLKIKGKLKARGYPKKYHITRIPLANGNHNAGLNAAVAKDAARMQDINEHNAALMKYIRPGMSPAALDEAIRKGSREERRLPQYWDDLQNRRQFNVRSDAVHAIQVTPDAKIQVKWKGSPTWYTFRQYPDTHKASIEAQKLLMSPSLGRAVWPVLTRKGGKKLAAKGYGKWNIEHYNGAYAK